MLLRLHGDPYGNFSRKKITFEATHLSSVFVLVPARFVVDP